MTAYRFCRTDDMALLVAAYEACRGPEDVDTPALELAGFKDLVRQLDLWCSSCMVALEGREPVGVLLGAKRAGTTLVYGLRVHPEHRRRGHGRHPLTSLGQKLAILGPPQLVAEVPAERQAARQLFLACSWVEEARLADWQREPTEESARWTPTGEAVAPIALGELISAGGLVPALRGVPCWQRDVPTLLKLDEQSVSLGFHSAERLEAWLLYRREPDAYSILAAGFAPDGPGRQGLGVLIQELARAAGSTPVSLVRAAPDEVDAALLEDLGFRRGPEHLLFVTQAQAA